MVDIFVIPINTLGLCWNVAESLGSSVVLSGLPFKSCLAGMELCPAWGLINPFCRGETLLDVLPNALWILNFSSLASRNRHHSQPYVDTQTYSFESFRVAFPALGYLLV